MLKKILITILVVLNICCTFDVASASSSADNDITLYNDEYKTEIKLDIDQLAEGTWKVFFQIHAQIAKLYILIIFASTSLGILIMVFSRKNKMLYKMGLITFVITIPMILSVVVFIVPQFYRVFY